MSLVSGIKKSIDFLFSILPRKKPIEQDLKKLCLIAHRGAHQYPHIIENTHAAFTKALELGCWGIELDVHATVDGILVVNHDATLERFWGQKIAIRDMSFEELRQKVPDIPTLAEVVNRYGKRLHLFIELKVPFYEEAVLKDTLASLMPNVDYHLLSLDETTFASLTHFPKETLLLVPEHNNVSKFCNLSLTKEYGGVMGHYLLLTDYKIQRLKAANQLVGVGIVNSKFNLYRELSRGIYWIFTDEVAKLVQK